MKIERMNKGNWGKVRAFFDLTTTEGFTIKGFRLVEGINGLFVSMPSQKGNDEQYYDTIWVESKSLRDELSQIAIEEYQNNSTDSMQPPQMNENNEESEMVGSNISSKTNTQSTEETQPAEPKEAFSDDDIPF